MKKLTSLGLCALLTPAITLGVSAALAQDADTNPQGAQTQQRSTPAAPGDARSQQQRAGDQAGQAQQRARSDSAQDRQTAQYTPILNKPADAILAEDLIGTALMSRQDQNFGPVNDFLIDQDGQVLAVIVGVGGFLGIGERDVAIGWDSLEHSVDDDGDLVLRVDMSDSDLRSAPAYSDDTGTSQRGAQTQQRAGSDSAQAQQRAGGQAGQAGQAQQRADGQAGQAGQAQQARQTAPYTPIQNKPAGAIRAEDLLGASLMSRQDQNFGPVNDFYLDRDGQVLAVIVGVGGFLGIGERDVAIGWDALDHSVDEDGDLVLHVDMTDSALREAPAFSDEAGTTQRGAQTQQRAGSESAQAQQRAGAQSTQAQERAGAQSAQAQQRAGAESAQAQQRAGAQSAQAQQRAGGQAGQAQRSAQDSQILSRPAGAISADDLTGAAVMSRQGENFGPINDFFIDEDGQVLAVIVGVGGFLGIGERDVAIAWDSLERTEDEDGDLVFRVNMTDADLRSAPAYRND